MMNDRYQLRAHMSQIATEAISGRRDLLSACRIIAQGRYTAGLQASEALEHIVAIESELDDIPGDDQRDTWSEAAYDAKQREKDDYLALIRDALLESLQCVIDELRVDAQ
jgi:hypothetical protein